MKKKEQTELEIIEEEVQRIKDLTDEQRREEHRDLHPLPFRPTSL